MKNRIISGAAALFTAALLAGGAVSPAMAKSDPTSDPGSQSGQTQRESAKGSMQKLYCVVETTTGSHIRTKDCRTRADWIAATGIDPAEEVRK
jgi:hypothetical protein